MLQLVLTGLVGVVLGVVIMRLYQKPGTGAQVAPTSSEVDGAETDGATDARGVFSRLSRNRLIFGGAGAMIVAAVGVVALRPSDATDASGAIGPLVSPSVATSPALDDVDTMIAKLATRLKSDTTDGEGFRMLGWSYVNTNRPADAIKAYEMAVKLLPNRADAHAGYGEAMVAVAKDVVTPQAKRQFDEAVRLDPKEPRARFFNTLYKAQNGQERIALDEWIALSNDSTSDQPWQVDLRQRIDKLATKLKVDVSGQLKAKAPAPPSSAMPIAAPIAGGEPDAATMKAAAALPSAQQQGMIDGMVSGLATKLQANPDNVEGWMKLIRSRVVLKDLGRANDDLAMARKTFANNPAKLSQINATAKELGL
jgi:cytochrome c-type biogenesis protein CcmH